MKPMVNVRVNKFALIIIVSIVFLLIYLGSESTPADSLDRDRLPGPRNFVNLKSLLTAAILAARRGGRKVFEAGNSTDLQLQSKGKTKEGADNLVTNADYASHCAMYYSLKQTFPGVTILSEEHTKDKASCENQPKLDLSLLPSGHEDISLLFDEDVFSKDVTVWIDPLDATQEFTETLYEYVTTMVCVALKGKPIIGVIYYPFKDQTYWGWFTKKVSRNIASDTLVKSNQNSHVRVAVSRSHRGSVTKVAMDAFGPTTRVTPAGGAGYKIIAVVNGTFDVYLHTTAIMKWDLCAGNAIVRALRNANMTTLNGNYIDYSPDSPVAVYDGILVTRLRNHTHDLSQIQHSQPKL